MVINKYIKNNNIIHIVNMHGIDDIKNLTPDYIRKIIPHYDSLASIFQYNEEFNNHINDSIHELNISNYNFNLRYIKEYINHGTNPKIGRVLRQNINCYKNDDIRNTINIYYDLTTKYTENESVILNRFVITYYLIQKLNKIGYKINFIPVLFLKAFDSLDNNEYVFIKFNNMNIDTMREYNLINNNTVSRTLLPIIIKQLDIVNAEALDYNGYLLERSEKESLIGLNNNDLLIDMFTSDNLFNGDLEHDSKVFYKKLNLK